MFGHLCLIFVFHPQLGGTIGDIEGMAFVEAFRQFQFKAKKENFCNIHVSLVPQVRFSTYVDSNFDQFYTDILCDLHLKFRSHKLSNCSDGDAFLFSPVLLENKKPNPHKTVSVH